MNETKGRAAGDQLIRDACALVCEVFKHSPVFRVAGDEFAVIAQGHDYDCADELAARLKEMGENGEPALLSCGMAKYEERERVSVVFARAEHLCREE